MTAPTPDPRPAVAGPPTKHELMPQLHRLRRRILTRNTIS